MNPAIQALNIADENIAIAALMSCCATRRWAATVSAMRPFPDEETLYTSSDFAWAQMREMDWMEAFSAHPRIGERKPVHASAQSTTWSLQEQSATDTAQAHTLAQLAEGNARYEQLFGFTYIVCATGKSAEQMLAILRRRLINDRQSELREAAEQQRQIMQIRLRKWLQA